MGVIQLLASSQYLILNKQLMKEIGIEESIMLSELCSEFDWFDKLEQLENGFFYCTVEKVQEATKLTEYKQRKSIKNLMDLGFLDCYVKGVPPKRYVKINESSILKFFENQNLKNLKSNSKNFLDLNVKKFENHNINNNITNNNIINKRFIKPSIEEIEDYVKERGNKINPKIFYDFYESKGWMVGKNKMVDWQACVRIWEQKEKKQVKPVPSWFDEYQKENKQKQDQDQEDIVDISDEEFEKIMEDFFNGKKSKKNNI